MSREPHEAKPGGAEPGMVITIIVLLFFVFIALAIGLIATMGRWLLIPVIGFVGYCFGRWRKWW